MEEHWDGKGCPWLWRAWGERWSWVGYLIWEGDLVVIEV